MRDANKDALVRHAIRTTVFARIVTTDTGETCVNMNAIRDAMENATRQMVVALVIAVTLAIRVAFAVHQNAKLAYRLMSVLVARTVIGETNVLRVTLTVRTRVINSPGFARV